MATHSFSFGEYDKVFLLIQLFSLLTHNNFTSLHSSLHYLIVTGKEKKGKGKKGNEKFNDENETSNAKNSKGKGRLASKPPLPPNHRGREGEGDCELIMKYVGVGGLRFDR